MNRQFKMNNKHMRKFLGILGHQENAVNSQEVPWWARERGLDDPDQKHAGWWGRPAEGTLLHPSPSVTCAPGVQFSSVAQSCLTLCNPMNHSTPGLLVHHQLLESTQTHPCPLSQWYHPTISSSVIPFSSCPQSFPASGSFPMSQLFASGGQSIRASVLPMNTQDFRMDWLALLALQGTLKSLLQHHSSKASILLCSAFFRVQLSHPYMTTGKTIALTRRTFVGKVMSLLFNMLSRLVVTFLLRSKHLSISWLQSPSLE